MRIQVYILMCNSCYLYIILTKHIYVYSRHIVNKAGTLLVMKFLPLAEQNPVLQSNVY